MSRYAIDRRKFLTLSLAVLVAPPGVGASPRLREGTFRAEVGILYGVLGFDLVGTVQETIDRSAGRYACAGSGGNRPVQRSSCSA